MARGDDVYGLHLTMRISDIEHKEPLGDPARVGAFLSTLVQGIGMRILAGPVTGVETEPAENAGCSGVVILYESHAALHTYAARGEAFLDIFSCRPFDIHKVQLMLRAFLGRHTVTEQQVSTRGFHWSNGPHAELERWRASR
jgi:S-adenosylmethionine decarboxylase